ncbi:S-adenosylmethionine decarboxylase proenzyme [Morus notabilis]|uniref:S-adenosylmethionine decarboxylase proenzyme n=1 Tax=Morus notabilis TaxID=981085 RepID=W9RRH6_9ROSA|nr:S-adenosylmethionine decarboxylase proenzyme [Morus notabilis]EXC04638.1 S-adenosylmethionine decarboxylase proenzyme [Morus notabilis]
MAANTSPIGFEGFEKRLEIKFSETSIFSDPKGLGLRALTRSQIDSILEPACCTIVSQLSNSELDSYVLSESSLFVFPFKIIIKTCGTTKLLSSIRPILKLADSISLSVASVKYSRGSFIFPDAQPSPHRSFAEEVAALNEFFREFSPRAYVIGDPAVPNRNWHVYFASAERGFDRTAEINLEMCMTGLSKEKAAVFFKERNNYTAKEMTKMSGVSDIIPGHVICDFDFDPCGYSMNGIEGAAYSTVHVTPEDGFSYASYEAGGFYPEAVPLRRMIEKVLTCFRPTVFSVAVTCFGRDAWRWAHRRADVEGYACVDVVRQELPRGGCIVYRSYSARSKGYVVRTSPRDGRSLKAVARGEAEIFARPCL